MKPIRLLLLAFLFSSLTLTACDSGNEKDEDTEIVEEATVTITETVVAPTAPVVQDINTAVATSFQAVVGENIVVSTVAGQITQTTSTSTSSTGGTTTSTTTIAPLVNSVTGQPTGQVAIVSQFSSGNTTTQVAGLTSANTSAPTLGVTSQDGTQTSFPFNASFSAQPAAVTQGSNAADQERVAAYNKAVASFPNLTSDFTYPDGKSAKQRFEEALALPGKQSAIFHLVGVIVSWTSTVIGTQDDALSKAKQGCQVGGSSVGLSIVNFTSGNVEQRLLYNCVTKDFAVGPR